MNDFVQISERDRERLLELISEYSGKLRQACDKYHANRVKSSIWLSSLVILMFAAVTAGGFDMLRRSASDELLGLRLFVLGLISVLMVGSVFYILQSSVASRKQDSFSITPLVSALERLVSRAAFLEDHAATNEDERLVITLRIAEGEAALEYAAWVLRKVGRMPGDDVGSGRRYRSRIASL